MLFGYNSSIFATIWLSFDNAFSLITLLFYFFVKNALTVIRVKFPDKCFFFKMWNAWKEISIFQNFQVFAKEVIEKVQELDQEKMKTEKAFHDFLPLTIVRDIKLKKVVIFIWQFFLSGCYDSEEVIAKKDYLHLHDSSLSRSLQRTLIAWRSSSATSSVSTISQMTALRLR